MENLFYSKFVFRKGGRRERSSEINGVDFLDSPDKKVRPEYKTLISPESQKQIREQLRKDAAFKLLGLERYRTKLERGRLDRTTLKKVVKQLSATLKANIKLTDNPVKLKAAMQIAGINIESTAMQKLFMSRGGNALKLFIVKIAADPEVFKHGLTDVFYKDIDYARALIFSKCPQAYKNKLVVMKGAPLRVRLLAVEFGVKDSFSLIRLLTHRKRSPNTVIIRNLSDDHRRAVLTAIVGHVNADKMVLQFVMVETKKTDIPVFRRMATSPQLNNALISRMWTKFPETKADYWVNSHLVLNKAVPDNIVQMIVMNLDKIEGQYKAKLANEIKVQRPLVAQRYVARINRAISGSRTT